MVYEMSVVWITLACLYSIMVVDASAKNYVRLLGFHGAITSVVYCFLSFKFFLFSRGCSLLLLVLMSHQALTKIPHGDPIYRDASFLCRVSTASLFFAYIALLLPEVAFCESYPRMFRTFQIHGLFNLLEGGGTYLWITYCTLYVYWHNNRHPKIRWGGGGYLPRAAKDTHLRARGA